MAWRLLWQPNMVAMVHAGSISGVKAYGVTVEVDFAHGLPGKLDIVGLPEKVVRESEARVLTAIKNSDFTIPDRKIIVNLAPADRPKMGSAFDLAIAVALLCRCGLCAPNRLDETLILGELSLEGYLRPVRGLLAQLLSAKDRGISSAIIPDEDAQAASLISGMKIYRAQELKQVVSFLDGTGRLPKARDLTFSDTVRENREDLCDVRGQESAKRALEIAAAGPHNILMIGPPGTGKTMLARRLGGLLPPPTDEEAIQIATIAGAGGSKIPSSRQHVVRPFRAPHHTVSAVGLIGGGVPIRPGEVTLSHLGVLFLDEFPEFKRCTIEALRPTMESGEAVVVRARERVTMPAKPLVVVAMNPCPCGYAMDSKRICRCTPDQIQRYRSRISGPMLDRFDIHIEMPSVKVSSLKAAHRGETTAEVRKRILAARKFRESRNREAGSSMRGSLHNEIEQLKQSMHPDALQILFASMEQLGLSIRAFDKVLRVARTIADLEREKQVQKSHVLEAIQYRILDRSVAH